MIIRPRDKLATTVFEEPIIVLQKLGVVCPPQINVDKQYKKNYIIDEEMKYASWRQNHGFCFS